MKNNAPNEYENFIKGLKLLVKKRPDLVTTTLGNIFTMRLIGNKTHGDLAEIAMSEFINQYLDGFRSKHVGKDRFRAKSKEEDIQIVNELTNAKFQVSLKAYGHGPLQLSTNKSFTMFPRLKTEDAPITNRNKIKRIFSDDAFREFDNINVLPLIYEEKKKHCNILVFDYNKAKAETAKIVYETEGKGRRHPVYRFLDKNDNYICEVRYGGTDANALQRGLWTNTKTGMNFFDSVTGGWIDYAHNETLVELFSHALVASEKGHKSALRGVKEDIDRLQEG